MQFAVLENFYDEDGWLMNVNSSNMVLWDICSFDNFHDEYELTHEVWVLSSKQLCTPQVVDVVFAFRTQGFGGISPCAMKGGINKFRGSAVFCPAGCV